MAMCSITMVNGKYIKWSELRQLRDQHLSRMEDCKKDPAAWGLHICNVPVNVPAKE